MNEILSHNLDVDNNRYDLSENQKGLWFLQNADENSSTYNIPIVSTIGGCHVSGLIYQSVIKILDEFPQLRVKFRFEASTGVTQEIRPAEEILIHEHIKQKNVSEFEINEIIKRPFDLSLGAVRLHIKEDYDNSLTHIILVIHHIIFDGLSLVNLILKFIDHLENAILQRPQEQNNTHGIFFEFIDWEKKYLDSKSASEDIGYWREKISSLPARLDLPYQPTYLDKDQIEILKESICLDKELVVNLRKIAKISRVNPSVLILAALKILLFRITGHSEIYMTIPWIGRPMRKFENDLGYYTNLILVKSCVKSDKFLTELVNEINAEMIESIDHASYPFSKLISESETLKGIDKTSFFNTSFIYQNIFDFDVPTKVGPYDFELLHQYYQELDTEYAFEVYDIKQGLEFSIKYRSDLFERTTIKTHLKSLIALLEGICENANLKIASYGIVKSDQESLINSFGKSDLIVDPAEACLHHLIEERCRENPKKVALEFDDQQLTYEQLDYKSEKLAVYLQNLGVGPDCLVGVLLDVSFEMIISILGILKAGGAYLPIDSKYPKKRIDYIISDSELRYIVTTSSHEENLIRSGADKYHCILIDGHRAKIEGIKGKLERKAKTTNLSYVIYTSGSTGIPKGVLVEHRNVTSLLSSASKIFSFSMNDVWTLFHSFCFDFSVWEIFGSLCSGAKLILVPFEASRTPTKMSTLIQDKKVTVLNQTPSAFFRLIEYGELSGRIASSLRYVIFGGEKLESSRIAKWYQDNSDVTIINMYGITETTVHVTYHEINEENIYVSDNTIGNVIPGLEAYVLSQDLKKLPPGLRGELFVSGNGVARGYLNLPKLTEEKFIDNPFSAGTKMYRTGDLARWSLEGNLEFFGRKDCQIKLNGFRIELEEIENTVLLYPGINTAAVVLRNVDGYEQLVSFYSASNDIESRSLAGFLRDNLPSYMIPTLFFRLENLPLTINGKIDRENLSEIDISEKTSHEISNNQIEDALKEIFREVLNIDEIQSNDNFFELGGDSIKAIQLISKSKRKGIFFTAQEVFESGTIAQLSKRCKFSSQVKSEPEVRTGDVLLTPIQKRFFELEHPNRNHWNQSILFEIPKNITLNRVNDSIEKLIGYHDLLRCIFTYQSGKWKQTYADPNKVTAKVEQVQCNHSLSTDEGLNELELCLNAYQAALDIENGMLVSVCLLQTTDFDKDNRLFITIHHLVVDGVSWRILIDDLSHLLENDYYKLEKKTTSYQYWSHSLTKFANDEGLRNEKSFWIDQVKNLNDRPSLLDMHSSLVKTNECYVRLEKKIANELLLKCNHAYNTRIDDLMLASLARSFKDWTGSNRLCVSLEGHGREEIFSDIDLSRTVGWFTSIYPVLFKLDEFSLGGTIKYVKEKLRNVPNKGIGYSILKYLTELKDFETLSEPDIVFNYLGDTSISNINLLSVAKEPSGDPVAPGFKDSSIVIDGHTSEYGLLFKFSCDYKLNNGLDLSTFASLFEKHLHDIIKHCTSSKNVEHTPSDFSLLDWDQDELDDFLDKI